MEFQFAGMVWKGEGLFHSFKRVEWFLADPEWGKALNWGFAMSRPSFKGLGVKKTNIFYVWM